MTIIYGIAIPDSAPHPELARQLVKFLGQDAARNALERAGFGSL